MDSPFRKKRSARRYVLVALLLVPLAGAATAWYALPGYVEDRARSALARVGDLLDTPIAVDEVHLSGFDTLVLRGLTVGAPDAPLLRAPQVVIAVDASSLMGGKPRLETITIEDAAITLARQAGGDDNFTALRRRVESLVTGDGRREGGTGEGIWQHLDRHIPDVRFRGGQVVVQDDSLDRSLIPSGLPGRLELPDLSITAVNESVMIDRLKLRLDAAARVPALKAEVKAQVSWDRKTDRGTVGVTLVGPATLALGDRTVQIDRAAWYGGNLLKLTGVRLGEQMNAREVTVRLREQPGALPAAGIERLLARLERLDVVDPEIRLGAGWSGWLGAAVELPPQPTLPAAEATASPPNQKRPRLQKKGARVREGLRALYASAERRIRKGAAAATALGRRFPLPELTVQGGRVLDPADGVPSAMAGLGRFNVHVRRDDQQRLHATLGFGDGPVGEGDDRVDATVNLDSGDLSLRVRVAALPLQPYRALLPSAAVLTDDTRLANTDLEVRYVAAAEQVSVDGTAEVQALGATLPWLASRPLAGVSAKGEIHAALNLKEGSLAVDKSFVSLGAARADLTLGVRDFGGDPVIEWTVDVPRTAAQVLVDALPAALLGQLQGLRVKGDVSWRNSGRVDTRDMRTLDYTSKTHEYNFDVVNLGDRIDLKVVNKPFVHRVQEGDGSVIEFTTGPGARGWVPLDEVSPWMAKVLTTTEDGTFFKHQGLAFFAIKDAIIDNLEMGRFYRGASTITQQVVKNLFLIREKTIARKLQEMMLAWQVDRYLTKERILELYLNIVELGPGVYGIGKASRHYFGKAPADLDVVECAFLASLLPNPKRYYYQFKRGEITEGWRAGIQRTLEVMVKRDKLTQSELEAAAPYSPVFRK